MKRFRIDRRTFLRGAGVGLALPLLDAMALPAHAQDKDAPTRLLWVFVPNGKHMEDWTPQGVGLDHDLPYLLEPLAPHREHMTVLSGLGLDAGLAHGDGPGDHARASATFLTGMHPVKTSGSDIRVGTSVDQVAARSIGRATRFPSLEVGLRARTGGRALRLWLQLRPTFRTSPGARPPLLRPRRFRRTRSSSDSLRETG